MRRKPLAFLLVVALGPGCSQVSVGLWADSDRGAASVASITAIEFPADPSKPQESKPREPEPPKPFAAMKRTDGRNATSSVADLSEPKAPTSALTAKETWTPRVHQDVNAAEHAADTQNYRWVQGRVSSVKINGAQVWEIRFAPYDQIDRYGGSFVLDGTIPPNLKEGDLVRIEGRPMTGATESSIRRYQCERLTIVRRPDSAKP